MTLTPPQRAKALLLASKSIRRCDVARVLDMTPAQFDTAVHGDREIINAFGVASKQAREAQPASVGYEAAQRHSVFFLMKDLKRDGAVLTPKKYDEYELQRTLRITCKCGNALAILHHAGRDVAANECEHIRARINACGCMRAIHTNKPKNRGKRNAA